MAFEDNKGKKDNKALFMRCFRLLDYLQKNTDKDHTITQQKLREKPELKNLLENRKTLHDNIIDIAEAMNSDADGFKPEEEWRLVYKAFTDNYGENSDDEEKMSNRVAGIYYNHIFSNDELTAIINSLRMSKAVDEDRAKTIIAKIKKELCSVYYKEPAYKLNSCEFTDAPELSQNLEIIQSAIGAKNKITFAPNYYDKNRELVPCGSHSVSPHYILANNGRFYLWCTPDWAEAEDRPWVFRIDLMTDIEISKAKGKPLPAVDKAHIRELPSEMSDEFKVKHLYMSYDEAVTVTLKWEKTLRNSDTLNYTILHDHFGDNFRVIKDGVIAVRCSVFGIVNFALQYSDCVTVLEPDPIRAKIAERVRELNNKYL